MRRVLELSRRNVFAERRMSTLLALSGQSAKSWAGLFTAGRGSARCTSRSHGLTHNPKSRQSKTFTKAFTERSM